MNICKKKMQVQWQKFDFNSCLYMTLTKKATYNKIVLILVCFKFISLKLVNAKASLLLEWIFWCLQYILFYAPGPSMDALLLPFAFIFMIAPCLSLPSRLSLLLPACPLGFASVCRQYSPDSPPFQNHKHGWREL